MTNFAPNWYPDPVGGHELRYFDGTQWTEHICNGGVTAVDPLPPLTSPQPAAHHGVYATAPIPGGNPDKIRKQVARQGWRGAGITAPVQGGSGSIFDEPVLVVNQKAKLVEMNNQYSIFNQHGQQIAGVTQVGQSAAKKALRLMSNVDSMMTHHLDVIDAAGNVMLKITRPRAILKSSVVIKDGHEREVGRIVQKNMIGKIRFDFEVNGQRVGALNAENWRAWKFRIEDAQGTEVARITKTWEGVAKAMFTTADNYVVQIHQRQPEPFNSLIVAAAVSVDTALKQAGG